MMTSRSTATQSPDKRASTRSGRRDDILTQAGLMFRAKGYHATSMRDLAKALDLRGSSLYAHVASKEDVLWEIVTDAAASFEAAAAAVPDDLPPRQRLEALISAHLGVVAAELATATVFFQDWLHLGPERRRQVIAVRDAYQRHFVDAIEAGKESGDFAVEDARLAALIVLSALNWSYQWLDPTGRLDLDEVAKAYAELLVTGLATRELAAHGGDVKAREAMTTERGAAIAAQARGT